MVNKPTIAISPVSHEYLTKGKEYEIIDLNTPLERSGYQFNIIDDSGDEIYCIQFGCMHADCKPWTLK